MRRLSLSDKILAAVNDSLSTVFGQYHAKRDTPAKDMAEPSLTEQEQKHSAGLIRVDHCGEVCAQALYDSQMIFARDQDTRDMLCQAKQEEVDHLAWCDQRLIELQAKRSYLNLLFYWSSFSLGLLVGAIGDDWSLGFVEETEIQVRQHLDGHLNIIAEHDAKSRAILQQMAIDETEHAEHARAKGARNLPTPIKLLMTLQAKLMTSSTYYL